MCNVDDGAASKFHAEEFVVVFDGSEEDAESSIPVTPATVVSGTEGILVSFLLVNVTALCFLSSLPCDSVPRP